MGTAGCGPRKLAVNGVKGTDIGSSMLQWCEALEFELVWVGNRKFGWCEALGLVVGGWSLGVWAVLD